MRRQRYMDMCSMAINHKEYLKLRSFKKTAQKLYIFQFNGKRDSRINISPISRQFSQKYQSIITRILQSSFMKAKLSLQFIRDLHNTFLNHPLLVIFVFLFHFFYQSKKVQSSKVQHKAKLVRQIKYKSERKNVPKQKKPKKTVADFVKTIFLKIQAKIMKVKLSSQLIVDDCLILIIPAKVKVNLIDFDKQVFNQAESIGSIVQQSQKHMQIPAAIIFSSSDSIFEEILLEYSSRCFEIQEAEIKDEFQQAELTCKQQEIQSEIKLEETEQFWSNIHDQPQECFVEAKEEPINDELFLKIKKVQLLRQEQEAKLNELIKNQGRASQKSQHNEELSKKSLYYPSKSLSPKKTKKIQKHTYAYN